MGTVLSCSLLWDWLTHTSANWVGLLCCPGKVQGLLSGSCDLRTSFQPASGVDEPLEGGLYSPALATTGQMRNGDISPHAYNFEILRSAYPDLHYCAAMERF